MFYIVAPALVAGIMIALTHAPLGIVVLKRGIVFIDLAVAQIAGLGLVAADVLLHEPLNLLMQGIALAAAMLAALFFRWVETIMPEQQEAIIGVSFILSASMVILLLAQHPHGAEEIQHLLSGEILFLTWEDVAIHAPIYVLIFMAWFMQPKLRSGTGFYLLFALAITSSVQLVGVYVVFASLILPALAALKSRQPHTTAWICGITAVIVGSIAAVISDMPAGSILVVSYVLTSVIFYKFHGYSHLS